MQSTSGAEMSGAGAPLGIRELMLLDRILIRQKMTMMSNNKYEVRKPDGTVILYAKEDSAVLNRMLAGTSRAFQINVFDTENKEVMRCRRPYTVGADKMEVSVCGRAASVLRRELTLMKPVVNVNDAAGRRAFRVKGPLLTTSECDFEIYTNDKKRIGVIRRKWGGLRMLVTNTDSYVIEVPRHLDVRYKAAFIGTCFLIDFMYYEN